MLKYIFIICDLTNGYHCGGGAKLQELLEWQLRVRSEQSWAVGPERAGLRLAELATYRASAKC